MHKYKKDNKLTLWGKDNDLFESFIKQNTAKIPALSEEVGLPKGSYVCTINRYYIQSTKLAKALKDLNVFPEVLDDNALKTFINNTKNLTQELLTPEILEKALAKIKK